MSCVKRRYIHLAVLSSGEVDFMTESLLCIDYSFALLPILIFMYTRVK